MSLSLSPFWENKQFDLVAWIMFASLIGSVGVFKFAGYYLDAKSVRIESYDDIKRRTPE